MKSLISLKSHLVDENQSPDSLFSADKKGKVRLLLFSSGVIAVLVAGSSPNTQISRVTRTLICNKTHAA
jgi:hypothetical protein